MVPKKNKTANSTLFIDASKEFVKVTNNKLTEDNISKIAAFTERTDPSVSAVLCLIRK